MVGHDAPGFARIVDAILPTTPNMEAKYWEAKYHQLLEKMLRMSLKGELSEELGKLRDEIEWWRKLGERFWGDCPCHEQMGLECENCAAFREADGREYR